MKLMEGKKGIIFGVSNKFGIANAIAQEIHNAGAEIAFTYANDAMEGRVRPIAEEMGAKFIEKCDVTNDEDMKNVFEKYEKMYGKLDFVVHAVAFANKEDLSGRFIDTSKAGWDLALGVSSYSLVSMCRYAEPLFNEGASVLALTYLGSEKVVANYNIMGVAKAALEASMRYLAMDLGEKQVRVNCLSSGPVKTLSARGISGFDRMLKASMLKTPMRKNVTLEEVGKSGLYFVSDLSKGVTGEVLHVDCGAHSVFASPDEMANITFD